jgi:hypothetical protein
MTNCIFGNIRCKWLSLNEKVGGTCCDAIYGKPIMELGFQAMISTEACEKISNLCNTVKAVVDTPCLKCRFYNDEVDYCLVLGGQPKHTIEVCSNYRDFEPQKPYYVTNEPCKSCEHNDVDNDICLTAYGRSKTSHIREVCDAYKRIENE